MNWADRDRFTKRVTARGRVSEGAGFVRIFVVNLGEFGEIRVVGLGSVGQDEFIYSRCIPSEFSPMD